MAREDGLAAIHLEMPDRVPRFDPGAPIYHWELIEAATGLSVTRDSPPEEILAAQRAFLNAWDYGIFFGCLIHGHELSACHTNMGHAVYAADGSDFVEPEASPFSSPEEVFAFDPWEVYGPRDHGELVRRFNAHYRERCEKYPDVLNTTGIYVTQMSAMIEIFGWDMLLTAAGTDPDRFGQVVNRYATWIQQYYDAVADSEAELIYSHDDLVWTEGPFIAPDWYRTYIFPNLKKLWDPLREAGKKILFVCDGNYTMFADDIAACGNHGFWFECFTDLQVMTEKFGRTHFIIGNGDCRPLTFGSKADVRAEVERCMLAGKPCPGYVMCISGHIPPNVPVENALHYNEVFEDLRYR
jgi:uroporphyrinogen-III decarboxylase